VFINECDQIVSNAPDVLLRQCAEVSASTLGMLLRPPSTWCRSWFGAILFSTVLMTDSVHPSTE
jgi:hypothetical protein